jgi:hypothetical protein
VSRPCRRQAVIILALTPVVLALDALAWLAWAAWRLLPWLLALAAAGVLLPLARRRGAGRTRPPGAQAGPGSWEPPSGEGDGGGSRDATVVDLRSRLLRVPGRERGRDE